MPPDDSVTVGELARSVRDVFGRLEGLARRLEDGQFVRTDIYILYKENVNQALAALERRVSEMESSKVSKTAHEGLVEKVSSLDSDKAEKSTLASMDARVAQLEDDKKWLVRLIIGFIILGVLGAVFAASGAAG